MFEEAKTVSCIWFLEGRGQNILASVYQRPDGQWVGEYRFRYYRDNKAHDSADERTSYRTAPKATAERPAEVIEKLLVDSFDEMFSLLIGAGYNTLPLSRLEVNGDQEKAFDIMSKQPWANIKFVTPDGRAPAQA